MAQPPEVSPEGGGGQTAPADVERAVRAALDNPDRAEAVLTLAAIATRAVAALNTVARGEANARRGAEDWGAWASLANAARDAVLKMATCRKVATDLARRATSPGDS